MSLKGNGLYSNWKMSFEDGTGYYVTVKDGSPAALGFVSSNGWPIRDREKEFEGAALVAPLSILFWEDE